MGGGKDILFDVKGAEGTRVTGLQAQALSTAVKTAGNAIPLPYAGNAVSYLVDKAGTK
eukprot:gene15-10923_t